MVPPESERPKLITQSHQSQLNFESIYATQRKFWWWPDLKKQIKEEWQRGPECACCKKCKTKTPPLYPVEAMAFKIGELWGVDLFKFRGNDFVLEIDKAS